MAVRDELEAAWAKDPNISREKLARAAGCSEWKARMFLWEKEGESITQGEPDGISAQISAAGISKKELSIILQSAKSPTNTHTRFSHSWGRDSFKFAAITDTHFGHVKSSEECWLKTCDLIAKENCQVAFHVGDITEGMSGRPGHIYELDAVGVNAQVELAERRLSKLPCPVEAITGNHDAWAFKAVGVDIGKLLESRLSNYKNLGPDEADVIIDGIKIKLWHGGDGASYATSYRTQKFVEGLSGGEKPHILLSGHAHKSIMHECRNVMVYECGTLCGQTGWMRGKKLAAHVGFWIIEVWPNASGIERIKSEWVPFFKEG